MRVFDFLLLSFICMIWGLNVVATRYVVGIEHVPPIFYAALRFGMVGLLLIPFLGIWTRDSAPRQWSLYQWGMVFAMAMTMGAVHFAFFFIGLSLAEASSVAVVGQLATPFSTILSVWFLGEHVGWRRALGVGLAFLGVVIIAVDPNKFTLSIGLVMAAIGALVGSFGAIILKKIDPMPVLQQQAWIGVFSAGPLIALSFFMETGQMESISNATYMVWVSTAFGVLAVSIFGHGMFYWLIQRYDVSLISPLASVTPIWGVVFGIVLLGEAFSLKLLVGGALTVAGVLLIALRQNEKMPEAALGLKVGDPS